jgi:ribosomal protein S18 acetylase RimI-like enzyme
MSFIVPDAADRARRLPGFFRLLLTSDQNAGLHVITTGGEAATLWRAPGRTRIGKLEMLRHAIPMLRTFGTALPRALSVGNAIEAHYPARDFWYLHIAGCDPDAQGQGFGGAAIRAGLARTGGLPAYLETATESNVGLYQRLGFAVIGEWHVPRGGPRFWSMWREGEG